MKLKTFEEQVAEGDLVQLKSCDEYAKYFKIVFAALSRLFEWAQTKGIREEIVADLVPLVERLIYTIGLLRVRTLHDPTQQLSLDLNDSGFPHMTVMSSVDVNLSRKIRGEIGNYPPVSKLLDVLVSSLIKGSKGIDAVLKELGESSYFEGLQPEKLFLPFCIGRLERLQDENQERRRYILTWGSYGSISNMPYLHSLFFEQDTESGLLEDKGEDWECLLRTLSFYGRHTPSVNVLMTHIDTNLPTIHPKILQRVQIGPLFAPSINLGDTGQELCELIGKYAEEDDFALALLFEMSISKGTRRAPRLFSRDGEEREIFFLPPDDEEAKQRLASHVQRRIILPHRVYQHVPDDADYFAPYKQKTPITYTKEGGIHVT